MTLSTDTKIPAGNLKDIVTTRTTRSVPMPIAMDGASGGCAGVLYRGWHFTPQDIVFLMALICGGVLGMAVAPAWAAQAEATKSAGAGRPALTVTVTSPRRAELPFAVAASGGIAAWQEASLGAEVGGLKLTDVRVNVGDAVKRGDLLARFSADSVEADLAQARAALVEAEAALGDARSNAVRARAVAGTAALSEQQVAQFLTQEKTAEARVAAQRAVVTAQELRLKYTEVHSPDDGTISARAATLGAVVAPGQELFRLIRGDRLEWRAEVTSTEIARVRIGQAVTVISPTGARVSGRVRAIAPTVDAQTRNATVYVELPAEAMRGGAFKAGMFARGDIVTGSGGALVVPLAALSLRDGFAYVFVVGTNNRVAQVKVQTGRRTGDAVEITGPLPEGSRIVASGGAFLADGDLVRVVDK